jgi:carbonic anhydrase
MKNVSCLLMAFLMASIGCVTPVNYLDQTNWSGQCNDNQLQSPIDIPCQQYLNVCPPAKGYQTYWQNPLISFGASPYEDLKTFFTNSSWVRFSNETNDYIFKSWQFHIHHPSEHTVNGQRFPMEIHLVHTLDSTTVTEYLVIGILFEEDSTLTYDIFDAAPIDLNTTFTKLFPFALTNRAAYHYRGSLTTPPCTEAVNWFVQTEPIKVRPASIERMIAKNEESNNRQIQRLGDRTVYLVGQGC